MRGRVFNVVVHFYASKNREIEDSTESNVAELECFIITWSIKIQDENQVVFNLYVSVTFFF